MSDSQEQIWEGDFTPKQINLLLTEVHHMTGYNFKDYAPATVKRRLQRRLITERMSSLHELYVKIKHSPQFAYSMIRDFSINVTEMFRDPHFFRYFRNSIIPELRTIPFIRVWIAGCSTGEEAYSVALLLREEGLYQRCRIYATDMNENVISQAKSGYLHPSRIESYSQNYLLSGGRESFSRYLNVSEQGFFLKEHLLEKVLFSHHNLAVDRSFNEFHVIFCRNVLIYFNKNLQDRVHELLYSSLAINGYLALGDKETIRFTKCASNYKTLEPPQKIFKRLL